MAPATTAPALLQAPVVTPSKVGAMPHSLHLPDTCSFTASPAP